MGALLAVSSCSGDGSSDISGVAPVATVVIVPGDVTLEVGADAELTAVLHDQGGSVLSGRTVLWSSPNDAIVTTREISLGVFGLRGDVPGQTTITATSEGRSASITVTVVDLPPLSPEEVAGDKIVFNRGPEDAMDIYLMSPDGTGAVNVTRHPADDIHASWSSDGSKVVFSSNRTGNYELYTMNVDGTGLVRLTDYPEWDLFGSWNGSKIAFERSMPNSSPGWLEIFVMNDDGTEVTNLTNSPDIARAPSFSPDGSRLAFASDRDDGSVAECWCWSHIWVMNGDGTGAVQLTDADGASDRFPEWSPDGTRIAFDSDRDGSLDIFVMDADGSDLVNVTHLLGDQWGPSWSPDSRTLLFSSANEIYSIRVDGTEMTRLTQNGDIDAWPAWRPSPTP